MEKWKLYAFAAAVFAGLTSVVAKAGLKTLSADLGLAVRTGFVCVFVTLNLFLWSHTGQNLTALKHAGGRTIALLAASALTTTLSWICYYRAMKDGTVAFVSLVDKGSILVTVVISILWLGEPLTWRIAAGTVLILAGLLVVAGGK
jgi:bacterial/archaeal transporter family protein